MKRQARIALNVLLPPLLGAGCFIVVLCAAAVGEFYTNPSAENIGEALGKMFMFGLMVTYAAYVVAGLPSLLHALLMEFVYRRLGANRWISVVASTMSGMLMGLLITGFIVDWRPSRILETYQFLIVGGIVGFALGLLMKWLNRPKLEQRPRQSRGCE
jgi:succinate dehydrogenase/fumarate reductase cytochrome b subunit